MKALMSELAEKLKKDPKGKKALLQFMKDGKKATVTLNSGQKVVIGA